MAAITSQRWRRLVKAYEVKAGTGWCVCSVKLCDPYLSASEVMGYYTNLCTCCSVSVNKTLIIIAMYVYMLASCGRWRTNERLVVIVRPLWCLCSSVSTSTLCHWTKQVEQVTFIIPVLVIITKCFPHYYSLSHLS